MHAHHVAHRFVGRIMLDVCSKRYRDCGMMNIMMDPRPLYPQLYHFVSIRSTRDMSGTAKHYTRTRNPVKYYFIDFGLSRKFDPAKGPPRSRPIWGGDRSVPEFHKSLEPCDPFPTDVYYLGNVIRNVFLNVRRRGRVRFNLLNSHIGIRQPRLHEAASRRHGAGGACESAKHGPSRRPVRPPPGIAQYVEAAGAASVPQRALVHQLFPSDRSHLSHDLPYPHPSTCSPSGLRLSFSHFLLYYAVLCFVLLGFAVARAVLDLELLCSILANVSPPSFS